LASAPATTVGGATAELSSLASICSRAARSENPNRPSCGQRSGGRPKKRGQVQISELFVEEKCSPAVLDFLGSTGVGRTVPREDGEDGEEDQDGASESPGAEE